MAIPSGLVVADASCAPTGLTTGPEGFFADRFALLADATNLQDRSPWVRHSSTTALIHLVGASERVRSTGGASDVALYYANDTPPSADYEVRGDLLFLTDNNTASVGVCGRVASGAATFYAARYNTNGNEWQLVKVVAGSSTTLGSSAATLLAGHSYRVALRMRGSALTLLVNGTALVTTTDAAITAAGFAGLRFFGVTAADSGLHVDNVVAWSLG